MIIYGLFLRADFSQMKIEFAEFRKFRIKNYPDERMKESFNLYMRYGGLPGIHSMPLTDEAVFPYLNAIFNTALLKDVVSRHKIREVELLERITSFIFSNCGNITSAKRISDFLKSQKTPVSVETGNREMRFYADPKLLPMEKANQSPISSNYPYFYFK